MPAIARWHSVAVLSALLLLPMAAFAQSINGTVQDGVPFDTGFAEVGQTIDDALGSGSSVGQSSVLIFIALTVLSLAPALAITVTCFPFMVTVMSILRQSLGLQQSPPNMLIVSLSLFLTWFVMDPVLTEAWESAGAPLQSGKIGIVDALFRAIEPFERFMAGRVNPDILDHMRSLLPAGRDADGLRTLIPSFMLSELQRAFEIGFLVALPFLVIDLVVSAVLMAMGMMMVPPAVVALPFKLAFFVAVDGWALVSAALVRGYQ